MLGCAPYPARRRVGPMLRLPMSEHLRKLLYEAGSGFLTGQAFAILGAGHHALSNSPSGHILSDFAAQLLRGSYDRGVEMATWSIVHSEIQPIIKRRLDDGWVQSALAGALTCAVLEARNGWTGMLGGALQGVSTSLVQSMLFPVGRAVLQPVQEWRQRRLRTKFQNMRNAAMFAPPHVVMQSAIFPS